MCYCDNVEIGSYDNQWELVPPTGLFTQPTICVDQCLAAEVAYLWSLGIQTRGCCCGHNEQPPTIAVSEKFIPLMKRLGYTVWVNPCRPNDEDVFYADSL